MFIFKKYLYILIFFSNLIYGAEYKELIKLDYVKFGNNEDAIEGIVVAYEKCIDYREENELEVIFKEFIRLNTEGEFDNFKIYRKTGFGTYCICIEVNK